MKLSNKIQRITCDMSFLGKAVSNYVSNSDDPIDAAAVVDSYNHLVDEALNSFTNSLILHEQREHTENIN